MTDIKLKDAMRCNCVVKNREEGESQREWFKRWMCMWHWMETDYYQEKLDHNRFIELEKNADSNPKKQRT